MKKKVIVLLTIIIIIIGLAIYTNKDRLFSNNKSEVSTKVDKIEQLVLFEAGYINFAWGFQHNGIFIDNQGNVKSFEVGTGGYNGRDDWKDGFGKEDIEANYRKATRLIKKIDLRELNEKYQMINKIKKSNDTDAKNEGNDMGSSYKYCYLWDDKNKKYNKIELEMKGDWSFFNKSPEAKNLSKWIDKFLVGK